MGVGQEVGMIGGGAGGWYVQGWGRRLVCAGVEQEVGMCRGGAGGWNMWEWGRRLALVMCLVTCICKRWEGLRWEGLRWDVC